MRSGKRSSRSQHTLGRGTTFLKLASITPAAAPMSTATASPTAAAAGPTHATEPAAHVEPAVAEDRGSAVKPAAQARAYPPGGATGATERPLHAKLPAPHTPATATKLGRPAKRSFDQMDQSQTEYVAIPTAQKTRSGAMYTQTSI